MWHFTLHCRFLINFQKNSGANANLPTADLGDEGHAAVGVVDVEDDLRVVFEVGELDALDHFVADGGDVVAARHHLLGYAEDRLDVAARARRVHHLR